MATFKYKVRAGDTPTTLASKFKTSPQAFLKANPGVSKLSQGMTIKIPSAPKSFGFTPISPLAIKPPTGVLQYPTPAGPPNYQYQTPAGPPKLPGLPVNTFEYFQQHQTAVSPSAKMAAYVAAMLRPQVVQAEQAAVLGWDAAEMQRRGYRLSNIGAGTMWTLSPEAAAAMQNGEVNTAGSADLPEGATIGRYGRVVTASGDSYATSAANSYKIGRGKDKWVMSSKALNSFRRRKMRGGASASVTQAAPALAADTRLVNWRISSG